MGKRLTMTRIEQNSTFPFLANLRVERITPSTGCHGDTRRPFYIAINSMVFGGEITPIAADGYLAGVGKPRHLLTITTPLPPYSRAGLTAGPALGGLVDIKA